jgi:hypothetical protein
MADSKPIKAPPAAQTAAVKKETAPSGALPERVRKAAAALGLEAGRCLEWAERPDGALVIVAGDGRKFVWRP